MQLLPCFSSQLSVSCVAAGDVGWETLVSWCHVLPLFADILLMTLPCFGLISHVLLGLPLLLLQVVMLAQEEARRWAYGYYGLCGCYCLGGWCVRQFLKALRVCIAQAVATSSRLQLPQCWSCGGACLQDTMQQQQLGLKCCFSF
jgi:hypothetical protein